MSNNDKDTLTLKNNEAEAAGKKITSHAWQVNRKQAEKRLARDQAALEGKEADAYFRGIDALFDAIGKVYEAQDNFRRLMDYFDGDDPDRYVARYGMEATEKAEMVLSEAHCAMMAVQQWRYKRPPTKEQKVKNAEAVDD